MHHIAESIAQDLDLDMPWLFDKTFDIEPAIAEVSLSFAARLSDRILQQIEIANNSHSLATAAGGGLDQERHPDGPCPREKCRGITLLDRGGSDRKAIAFDKIARADLVAHQFDRLGRWADEGDACRGNRARKTGIFRQEAVAWMQCAGTNSAGSRYDLLGIEISRYRRPPRDLESDIGERYCRRCSIDLVIDDRRAQTKLAQRANDPDGNLAPVGDQDGLERKGNSSH